MLCVAKLVMAWIINIFSKLFFLLITQIIIIKKRVYHTFTKQNQSLFKAQLMIIIVSYRTLVFNYNKFEKLLGSVSYNWINLISYVCYNSEFIRAQLLKRTNPRSILVYDVTSDLSCC